MIGSIGSAVSAFSTGFAIGLSLIMAIGAQNAFVLRQGLMHHHMFAVALFCAGSDALLIAIGVGGVSLFVADFATRHSQVLFAFASLWLGFYGALRLRAAISGNANFKHQNGREIGLFPTLLVAAMLTFGNPHVYLDTVVLIGIVSLQFEVMNKIWFGLGATSASFFFFFTFVYGAKFLAPLMESANAWRMLDVGIAVIMFALALSMLNTGGLV